MSTVTSYAVRYIDKDGFIRDFSNTREFVENVREIDKKVENITIRLDNFDKVEETLTKKIDDNSTQLGEKITESHNTLNNKINELGNDVSRRIDTLSSDLIEDLDGINNTIAETKEELTTKINNIETCTCDTSAIEKSINSINSQISSIKLNISSNSSQINSLKQTISTNTSNITTLNDNINLITTNMTLLEEKVNNLETKINELSTSMSEMSTSMSEMSTTLDGIRTRTKDIYNGVVLATYDGENYYGYNLYDLVNECCKKLIISVPSSQLKEEGCTEQYWYDMTIPEVTRDYIISETSKVIGK